jgi:hypothetical protein
MVVGFTRSTEGEAEYRKLGLPYPDSIDDQGYEKWIKDTSADDLSKYSHHSEREVSSFSRHKLGADAKEFIPYHFTHYRLDEALNVVHRFRPNIGIYPIPRARYVVKQGAFGKQERQVAEVMAVETGYSIPFNKKNMDKIRDIGLQAEGRVSYTVRTPSGISFSIASYEDLRDGEFNELAHFGRIPTELQRRRWIDEKGIQEDQKQQQEIVRRQREGDVPQIPVTADKIREIVKQEKQEKK